MSTDKCSGSGSGGKDPWVHRSTGMCCVSCMWFVEKVSCKPMIVPSSLKFKTGETVQPAGAVLNSDRGIDPYQVVGRCRRHAPTMNGYPVVFNNDWCGDHKLDENSIQ